MKLKLNAAKSIIVMPFGEVGVRTSASTTTYVWCLVLVDKGQQETVKLARSHPMGQHVI